MSGPALPSVSTDSRLQPVTIGRVLPRRRLFRRSHVRDVTLWLAIATAYHWRLPMGMAGIALVLGGLVLQIWSKASLRRNCILVSTGPYAICRHPFYLGNSAFDLGLCLMSGDLALVALYPLLFWLGYWPTFQCEEGLLRSRFGEKHIAYCRRASLLFPGISGVLQRWRSPCSWEVLLRERELSRAIRHLALPFLVGSAAYVWQTSIASFSPTALVLPVAAAILMGTAKWATVLEKSRA